MKKNKDFDFFDIASLREDYDVEFKAAGGKDGKGELPKSFWETYSAMANTHGGYILLGVKEDKQGKPVIKGVSNVANMRKALWDNLNNPQKVSANILSNNDIFILNQGVPEQEIICIKIPQAPRQQRPVFINGNPLTGTYRRNYEGDYKCHENIVRNMLAEQTNDSRDSALIRNFNFDDINIDSFRVYRQNFSVRQPNHPFNEYNDIEFLRNIGGWKKDRDTGEEGLTLAGLLMFGRLRSILDAVPNYIVDYQERPRAITENRWVDRITTDFSWSGNLYDFYRRVITKLCENLKTPFALNGNERIDDTPVHVALREAMVNSIIHADYAGNTSILIVKRPDLFGFRNPGLLRIPQKDALNGGNSDCRNRNLQKMFQLIGLGEQAGSGFPKIYAGWASQHWKEPNIEERIESNQTILVLSTMSLLPDEEVDALKRELGQATYNSLSKQEIVALITTSTEGSITHRRFKELTKDHPADLSRILHGLVEKGLLRSEGAGQATFYYRPGKHPINTDFGVEFTSEAQLVNSSNGQPDSDANRTSSDINEVSSDANGASSDANGVSSDPELKKIAEVVANTQRTSKKVVANTILQLCLKQELSAREIASLLNRKEKNIRSNYLNNMCQNGEIIRKYPNLITHPQQKYSAPQKED